MLNWNWIGGRHVTSAPARRARCPILSRLGCEDPQL